MTSQFERRFAEVSVASVLVMMTCFGSLVSWLAWDTRTESMLAACLYGAVGGTILVSTFRLAVGVLRADQDRKAQR